MPAIWRACAWISLASALGLGAACAASEPGDDREGSGSGAGSGVGGGAAVPSGGQGGGVDLCSCPAPLADCNGDPSDGCEVNTAGDVEACGGCSPCEQVQDREAGHAWVECIEGKCTTTCDDEFARGVGCWEIPSWKDCDGVVANGCEVDVLSDAQHCGTCGTSCPAGTFCFQGQCGCPDGYVVCGETCANLDTDADHCGACGAACPDPDQDDDLVPTCKAGVCGTGCDEKCGEFDCDDDPSTPCVTLDEPENCGACGNVCASGVCQTSEATAPVCCDESQVDDDVQNCGACGNDCSFYLAPDNWWTVSVACVAGACQTTCVTPYGDCDGDPDNGCETDTETSTSSCGGCGHACAEGELCIYGRCAPICEAPR